MVNLEATAGKSLNTTSAEFVRDTAVTSYFLDAPFDPPEDYPELPPGCQTDPRNDVYGLVRQLLQKLELDAANLGTPQWNPFRDFIKPGDTVVIKPNLVTHKHYLGPQHLYSTIIHGSVLRPLVDYIKLALGSSGSILIADNPIEGADFDELMRFTGIGRMTDELKRRGYGQLDVIDLRPRVLREQEDGSFVHVDQPGDPRGYVTIDLGRDSLFAEFDSKPDTHYYTLADPAVDHIDPRFAGSSTTDEFHHPGVHKYVVSRTILNADVLINVAKMKCHCKSGVSLNLKNIIGVVYDKFCMPHHRPGMLPDGDSFPHYPASHYVLARKAYVRLRKLIGIHRLPGFRSFRDSLQKNKILVGQHIEHGNWKGNDTIWRTILDLNRIVLYGDSTGEMHDVPQRRSFCLIDGIISQQGDAPINGEAIATSTMIGGFNPAITDALALRIMGIELEKIKAVSQAAALPRWPLMDGGLDDAEPAELPDLQFSLSKGWM